MKYWVNKMFDFDYDVDIIFNRKSFIYGEKGCWIIGEPESLFPCKCCIIKNCKEYLKKNNMQKTSIFKTFTSIPDMR